jgi:undecaprenyl-diphosphatase
MEFLFLIILGIIQGICEFLPISSSGHLVLFSKLFGVEETLFVSIFLHIATLLSIVVVFWKDVKYLICHPFSKQAINIYIATIPTCLIVLALMPVVNFSFGGKFLSVCFLITSGLLLFVQCCSKKKSFHAFNAKDALVMGIMQGLAVFPGISRSGATVSGGLISGAERKECAKFSFLMSVPVIILSMLLEIYKLIKGDEILSVNWSGLVASFIFAFFIGIISIKAMIKLTNKVNFKWFSLYLFLIAIVCAIVL